MVMAQEPASESEPEPEPATAPHAGGPALTVTWEAPKALKLGSVRVEPDFRVRKVDLRNLFGTD